MGKKKRYMHYATKFAKKYFKILDTFDGNTADDEIEQYDAFIDTLTATDLENQTVRLQGRVLGKVTDVANDGIEYSLDGAAFVAVDNAITRDGGAGGLDEFTYDSGTGGSAIGIGAALSVGTHTVIVRPKSVTSTQRDKELTFTIRENKIAINTAAFTNDTAGNIAVDASAVIGAGKKVAGNNTAASFTQNGYKVTAKDANGDTLAVTGRADVVKNAGTDGDILNADVANGTLVTLTITPKDSTNALLSDSAIEHTITVTA